MSHDIRITIELEETDEDYIYLVIQSIEDKEDEAIRIIPYEF